MKIFLASDHQGFKLKGEILKWVTELGHEGIDLGPFAYKPDDDYPEFIKLAGREVSMDPVNTRAIILGSTGEGEAIVANRFPKVRAAVYYGGNREIVKLSREHNDSNVLSLGARFLNDLEARQMVELWLTTEFTHESRHVRRLAELDQVIRTPWFRKIFRRK